MLTSTLRNYGCAMTPTANCVGKGSWNSQTPHVQMQGRQWVENPSTNDEIMKLSFYSQRLSCSLLYWLIIIESTPCNFKRLIVHLFFRFCFFFFALSVLLFSLCLSQWCEKNANEFFSHITFCIWHLDIFLSKYVQILESEIDYGGLKMTDVLWSTAQLAMCFLPCKKNTIYCMESAHTGGTRWWLCMVW